VGGYSEARGEPWASPRELDGGMALQKVFLEGFPRAIHWVAAPQEYIIQVIAMPFSLIFSVRGDSMRREYSYEDYKRAMELLNKGLGPTRVSRILDIPKHTIRGWIYQYKVPWLARWAPEPSKELAYVLGVLYGDGYTAREYNSYYMELLVKDYEFAEAFSRNIAKVLNKRYKKPTWSRSNTWRVYYSSKAFYTWFKRQSLETLKKYIEYNKDIVKYFLQGLYDSEGSNYRCRGVFLCNSDLDLLRYIQYLLKKYFDIRATGPYLHKRAGSIYITRNGRKFKANHNIYILAISRKRDIHMFLSHIGFSIKEKQLGLPRRRRQPKPRP